MKKSLILFALLLATAFSYSQKLTVNESGNVFDPQNNKWTVTEVRDILYTSPKALELYNTAREKKTWGNVFLYGGLGVTTASLLYYSTQDVEAQPAIMVLGAVMVLVAIPVKIGHTKKVKKAIDIYNNSLDKTTTSTPIKVTLTASQDQIGFKYQF